MEKGAIGDGGFNAVADGVAKVQECSYSGGFLFVFFDNAGFDRDVARDEFGGDVLVKWVEVFEVAEHVFIADGGVLDNFGKALAVFTARKGEEGVWVDEDEARLVKGADEVFSFGDIDAGFTSDSRVDL